MSEDSLTFHFEEQFLGNIFGQDFFWYPEKNIEKVAWKTRPQSKIGLLMSYSTAKDKALMTFLQNILQEAGLDKEYTGFGFFENWPAHMEEIPFSICIGFFPVSEITTEKVGIIEIFQFPNLEKIYKDETLKINLLAKIHELRKSFIA